MKRFLAVITLCLVGWAWGSSSDQDAYTLAKNSVDERYRARVLSMLGKGTEKEFTLWRINFFDPESKTLGKVMDIRNGKIDGFTAASSKMEHAEDMAFDPAKVKVNFNTAMATAKKYADENQVNYDGVNALLRRQDVGTAPTWRIELLKSKRPLGVVYTTADNGSFAGFRPHTKADEDSSSFGKDIEKTFKGIGADLEEFFTGDRTVDKD